MVVLRALLLGVGVTASLSALVWILRLAPLTRASGRWSSAAVLHLLAMEVVAFLAVVALELWGPAVDPKTELALLVALGGLFAVVVVGQGGGLVQRIAGQLTVLEVQVDESLKALAVASRAAEAHRARLDAVVAGAQVAPFEYDQQARWFSWCPPNALGLVLEGRGLDELVSLVDEADRRELIAALGGSDPAQTFEFRLRGPQPRWLRMLASVTAPGKLSGLLLDVTQRKTLELDLQQAHKLEAIGQLASGLAHEINTPVQFIGDSVTYARETLPELVDHLGYVEALARSNASVGERAELEARREAADLTYTLAELPQALDRALEGVKRVGDLVRAMKDFARGQTKEGAPADLNRAIESTAMVARNEYKYVAHLVFEPGELPLVTCRVGDISQVVLNLIINAAHAIDDKRRASGLEAKGTIRVRTSCAGELASVVVEDDGCGIPSTIQGRIFEPFFTTKDVGRGSGQGLAICRSIAARHGGKLWFESREGEGTRFHLELPLGSSEEARSAPGH